MPAKWPLECCELSLSRSRRHPRVLGACTEVNVRCVTIGAPVRWPPCPVTAERGAEVSMPGDPRRGTCERGAPWPSLAPRSRPPLCHVGCHGRRAAERPVRAAGGTLSCAAAQRRIFRPEYAGATHRCARYRAHIGTLIARRRPPTLSQRPARRCPAEADRGQRRGEEDW